MRTPVRSRRSEPAAPAVAPPPGAIAGAGRSPDFVARLVALDPGFYAFTLAGNRRPRERIAGLPLPAIHVCAAQEQGGGIEVTDEAGNTGAWLGGGGTVLFVKSPSGGVALVTAYLARGPDTAPLDLEIRRIDPPDDSGLAVAPAAAAQPPIVTLRLGADAAATGSSQLVGLAAVVHVRGQGDVRFADAALIGRLGPGQWIEAFTLASPDAAVAAAIEYKGLSASGTETPWLGCGAMCGATGTGVPLVGFAVRQSAGAGSTSRFDCEYTGYFQSGAVAGPLRNGAPCRSPNDDDPLEGMALRVTPRPARSEPAAAG